MSASELVRYSTEASSFFTSHVSQLVENMGDIQHSYFQDHFTLSKRAIIQAALPLKGRGKALFLGWGGGNDLPPLLPLAYHFTHIKLVDMAVEHARKAVRALPEALQSRFTVEQTDLSGVLAELDVKLEELKGAKLPFETFVLEVLEFLSRLEIKPYECSDAPFSFICSSLISSQLEEGVYNYLDKTCHQLYGQSMSSDFAFEQLGERLALKHLQDLHRLVDVEGRVYFADNFSMRRTRYIASESRTAKLFLDGAPTPVRKMSMAQDVLLELFEPICLKTWSWSLPTKQSQAKTYTVTQGSIKAAPVMITEATEYHITSLTLIKK